jgi:hypothetical protein
LGSNVHTMFIQVHTHTTPTHTSFQAPSSLLPSSLLPTPVRRFAGRTLPIQSLLDCQAAQARLTTSKLPQPRVDIIDVAADAACAPCATCLSVPGWSFSSDWASCHAPARLDTAVVRFQKVVKWASPSMYTTIARGTVLSPALQHAKHVHIQYAPGMYWYVLVYTHHASACTSKIGQSEMTLLHLPHCQTSSCLICQAV